MVLGVHNLQCLKLVITGYKVFESTIGAHGPATCNLYTSPHVVHTCYHMKLPSDAISIKGP